MIKTITLKELRPELPEVINNVDRKLDRYIVTKRGKPVAVLISVDDYESMLETIDLLSDKEALKRIKAAEKEVKEGKTVSLDMLRKRLKDVQN